MYVSVNIYILYTHNCTWYCHCLSKFPHDQYGIMFIFCWVQFHSTPLNPTNQPVIIPVLVALFLRGASPGSSPGRSAASRSWWGWRTWDGIKKFHGIFWGNLLGFTGDVLESSGILIFFGKGCNHNRDFTDNGAEMVMLGIQWARNHNWLVTGVGKSSEKWNQWGLAITRVIDQLLSHWDDPQSTPLWNWNWG